MIHQGLEVQQGIINYRKDGKPFLNLLTLIPISWDIKDIRYFIGFQVDIAEHPETKSGQDWDNLNISYILSHISPSIWTPTTSGQWGLERGQTLNIDDSSTLFPNPHPEGPVSDLHGQLCNKMLFGTTGHVVHVLSSKGIFLYLSPACKQVLEYSVTELVGQSLSFVCHPYDIVPVTCELKNTATGNPVNVTFRIRRKNSGYTWFESYGSLLSEKSNGRKCILLVGRKRPVFSLGRQNLIANGGISDSELWTKISISGMFLFVSSNIKALLGWQPETLIGTSMQDLMGKKSWLGFRRSIEQASKDKIVACKHEVKNRRNQVLQARTTFYPGDVVDGRNPSFLLAQTQFIKASTRKIASTNSTESGPGVTMPKNGSHVCVTGLVPQPAVGVLSSGVHDIALASKDNVFDELRPTKSSNWQFELRQLEKNNRILVEELGKLLANKKKHKKRKRVGNITRGCANCHTQNTPEWRRGPSGQRDLCNSCGLRWAKQAKNLL